MTKYKDKQEKQEELKSCPVAAALAPVRQLQKGEQVSALIFAGGGTKGAAYAGVVKALDAAGLVKDVKHFAGASAGAMTAAILQKQEVKENKISGPFAFVGFLKALLGTMMTVNSQSIGVASKLREAKLDDDQCQSLAVKLPKDTDVIMIDVGDAVSFDDNLEAVEITAMEARGREAVERYLEYDLPAEVEVSARHANY